MTTLPEKQHVYTHKVGIIAYFANKYGIATTEVERIILARNSADLEDIEAAIIARIKKVEIEKTQEPSCSSTIKEKCSEIISDDTSEPLASNSMS